MTLVGFSHIVALAALVVVVGWVVGDVLLRLSIADRLSGEIGLPERALAVFPGFVAFSAALMLVNIATSGAVFGGVVVVPAAAMAAVIVGVRRGVWPRGVPWLRAAAFGLLLSALFIVPVVVGGTGARTGDTPWHLGWTAQLLGGDAVPTGPAPNARNAYPWGWHAVLASTARLVPGSDALDAHDAWDFLLVFAIPLAAACLARRLRRDAGWAAAGAVGLIGGWGWLSAGKADFVTSPLDARYGADLMVASPNGVYQLMPPAVPRELALVLLVVTGVLLVLAARDGGRRLTLAAAVGLGLTGLVNVPMLVSGVAWTLAAVFTARRRLRFGLVVTAAALAVLAPWAIPLAVNYVRFGGFVDVTRRLGVEWPLGTGLAAWGILVPFAVAGLWLARRATHATAVFVFCGASALLLLATKLRAVAGWDLAGNPSLLHQGRVWPAAHLLVAALAGVAVAHVCEHYRARAWAPVAAAGVIVVGVLSPLFASARMVEILEHNEEGFAYDRPDLADGSFAERAAARLGPDDVLDVSGEGGHRLAFVLWQLSGARLAHYDAPERTSNDLRIRFADLANEWDRRAADGGFEPTVGVRQVRAPKGALTGEYGDLWWRVVRAHLSVGAAARSDGGEFAGVVDSMTSPYRPSDR